MKNIFILSLFILSVLSSTLFSVANAARYANGPTDRPQGGYNGYYVVPSTGYTVPAYPVYPAYPLYPAQPIAAPATCGCFAFNAYSRVYDFVTNVYPNPNLYPADRIVQAQQLCYNWVVHNLNYNHPVVNGTTVDCGY